jgi:hypothetical protein
LVTAPMIWPQNCLPEAGAVWVGNGQGTATARVDPERLRVTARFGGHAVAVAHGVLWSYCCVRGDRAMGFGRVDARTLRPRPPLVVKDTSGRRQPVGRLAIGTDAVWNHDFEQQRLWRVPLAGGPARAVVGVAGVPYGLAADAGAMWLLSGTGDVGGQRDRTGRLRRLDQRTGEVTATTPLPDLEVGRDGVAVGLAVGGGAVWVPGPYARLARWRHPAAGRSRLRAGGRVASRPALVLPGCARRRSAWSVGGHRGGRAHSGGRYLAFARRGVAPPWTADGSAG